MIFSFHIFLPTNLSKNTVEQVFHRPSIVNVLFLHLKQEISQSGTCSMNNIHCKKLIESVDQCSWERQNLILDIIKEILND